MEFRKAVKEDAMNIMNIIKGAQDQLKEQKIDQWQNGYPNIETILKDTEDQNGYVLIKNGNVVGYVVAIFGEEKNYKVIYEGKWLSNQEYVVIHRLAIDNRFKGLGLASIILRKIKELCLKKGIHSIKIDTHRDNNSMQRLLQKNGFTYCGILYLEDGSERIGFEKLL